MRAMRVYEKLLTVYPRSFRSNYSEEMQLMLQDMLAAEPNAAKRLVIWTRAFTELPIRLGAANFEVVGKVYSKDMPNYVFRNTQLSAIMVFPFIALLVFNELRPNVLPTSSSAVDVLRLLTVGLPFIAFILSATTILLWSNSRRKSGQASMIRSMTDISHNCLLAVIGGFAFAAFVFMIGHDSAQCVNGNPIAEVRNFTNTIQCINRD